MPTISKQLLILQRLTAHLDGITEDNGYSVNVAGHVYRGRTVFGDESELPALSLIEAPRPDDASVPAGAEKLKRLEQWVLLLQGWSLDDGDNPTDSVYELKAAAEKRLSEIVVIDGSGRPVNSATHRLGGLIDSMIIGPGVVRPPQENVSSRAFFYLPLTIGLVVDLRQPFVTVP